MHKFKENIKYDIGIYPQLSTATNVTGVGVDMSKYNNFAALVGAAPATQFIGAFTAYIAQSTDNTTFSTSYLATVTVASSTTLGYGDSLEVRAEQMSDTYRYLRVEILPAAGTTNYIAAANLRFNSRYPQATLP